MNLQRSLQQDLKEIFKEHDDSLTNEGKNEN